jgi:hypothetical protein
MPRWSTERVRRSLPRGVPVRFVDRLQRQRFSLDALVHATSTSDVAARRTELTPVEVVEEVEVHQRVAVNLVRVVRHGRRARRYDMCKDVAEAREGAIHDAVTSAHQVDGVILTKEDRPERNDVGEVDHRVWHLHELGRVVHELRARLVVVRYGLGTLYTSEVDVTLGGPGCGHGGTEEFELMLIEEVGHSTPNGEEVP